MTDITQLAAALADRYRLEPPIGRGGMATVYRARDLKHDRDVAVKVLHPELAAALGTERFLAEIRTTANLQHPNILPLFDSGEAAGLVYYVMPFVAGESLRERLTREQQLPVDTAVRLAEQVAGALDHAHRHGIIHRDIKPENILLSEGQALVADFGIALAVTHSGGARLTQSGISVGTPQYMSPEQAAAEREVDRRTDIYALGAVLYEMLAGAPPYTGPTAAAITARKLTEPVPPLRTVRDTVPGALDVVVRKALARTPADRYATAQEFAQALAFARSLSDATTDPTVALPSAGVGGRGAGTRRTLMVATIIVLAAGAGILATWRHFASRAAEQPPVRFSVRPLPGDSIVANNDVAPRSMALSADGWLVAFVARHANDDTTTHLFIHNLRTGVTTPLAGTESAYAPFFKPDGSWIAYFDASSRRLMKVPAQGGQPQPLCNCSSTGGGDWSDDGWIVFDPGSDRQLVGLQRVRETGGMPETIPVPDTTFSGAVWGLIRPRLLPGRKVAIVSAMGVTTTRVSAISLETGQRTDLVRDGWMGEFVEPGYLVYAKTGELWAAPFDPDQLRVTGEPRMVLDSLQAAEDFWAEFAISRAGTLVYSKPVGVTGRVGSRIVWADRTGAISPVPGIPAGCWMGPRLSPDQNQIVFWGWTYETCGSVTAGRLWLFDRRGGAPRPLTDPSYTSAWPIFAPDGRSVISNSNRESSSFWSLYRTPIGGGGPEPVTRRTRAVGGLIAQQPSSFSPDGKLLAFQEGIDPKTLTDIYVQSVDGDRTMRPLLTTRANERLPAFSPDGRWLAYASDESGRMEVYVRAYPAFDAAVQVTHDGGDSPVWFPSGRDIAFKRGLSIYTVPFIDGRPGTSHQLIDGRQQGSRNALAPPAVFGTNMDIAKDGRILTIQRDANTPGGKEYQVVLNWFTELGARFAAAKRR